MRRLFAIFILCAVSLPARTQTPSSENIVFIVNAANPASRLSYAEIRDYFLKVKREWPDGTPVRFIDKTKSPERAIFLKKVVKKSVEEVDRYWIGEKLYSGNSAPVQSSSDQMVIQFVGTFNGAIGYISPKTEVTSKKVKTIEASE